MIKLGVIALFLVCSGLLLGQPPDGKVYKLFYDEPAAMNEKGWEKDSLPLGNGYFGVSFFGGTDHELWQFSEQSLFIRNPKKSQKSFDKIGFSSMCELHLKQDFDGAVENYQRELDINKALGMVSFDAGGTTYSREVFTSYPGQVFAARLTASGQGKISFTLSGVHPYINEKRIDAKVSTTPTSMTLYANTLPYNNDYEVRVSLKLSGGTSVNGDNYIEVQNADEVLVLVSLATRYKIDPKVFATHDDSKKLEGMSIPREMLDQVMENAMSKGWNALLSEHVADYTTLFSNVSIDLGGEESALTTDELLTSATGAERIYLEEFYFHYGRYLLIASSRKGTLPANLQGIWGYQKSAKWTGGYWANINMEMNYWPAFSTGLEETFVPYFDFWNNAFNAGKFRATTFLEKHGRDVVSNAWTTGTANSPYKTGFPGATSGIGSGPFVLYEIWNWYLFTMDESILEDLWPMLIASSNFLSKALVYTDGAYLADPSWSPEQKIEQPGTAYDQQLVYENYRITLRVAEILGKYDPILDTIAKQLPHLDPVLVGASGQIKEFREEKKYGDFGKKGHRHISQLIGLMPGTIITEKKEWLEAAAYTLNQRGIGGTGWSNAHRLNAWARVKDGNRAYDMLTTQLNTRTLNNLWCTHPPFQIDGNFGATSGIAEMLIQSHEGFIDVIPAIPDVWSDGSFSDMRARGAFKVSAEWTQGEIQSIKITSLKGADCKIQSKDIQNWKFNNGSILTASDGILTFPTEEGSSYVLTPLKD